MPSLNHHRVCNVALGLTATLAACLISKPALAQSAEQSATPTSTSAAETQDSTSTEDIIVTAQKSEQRLRDVPVPVTAISATALVERNQTRLQDFYSQVPGLTLTTASDVGFPQITIRGISTGGLANPTVGIVVDDVPYGASTITGGGTWTLDLDPSDLARIEVLRGPQGTLYGASSIGGLIKYVTADPSTAGLSGRVETGLSFLENGHDIGYSLRGSFNMPASDNLAVRASGYVTRDPGYIDDPVLGARGVNERNAFGGRLSVLWRPTNAVTVKLGALLQNNDRDGESNVFRLPTLDDLQHTELINTGWYKNRIRLYTADITADLGGGTTLTSVTGYGTYEFLSSLDASPVLGAITQARFGVGGIASNVDYTTRKFSEEVRLDLPLGSNIDWLIGGFYTHESYPQISDIIAVNPTDGKIAGSWWHINRSGSFEEYAAFTNLTFKLSDRFDIQFGGRLSHNQLTAGAATSTGPWNVQILGQATNDVTTPAFTTSGNAFTYLVTPRFKISDNAMLYARLSSGYRPGGPNLSILAGNLDLPKKYDPDRTNNYEIGFRGGLLDNTISIDASIYYIDWKDIQIQLRDPATFQLYYVNGGGARSKGAELSVELHPARGLRIGGWISYNDAAISRAFPTGVTVAANPGDRLPYSARWTENLSVNWDFELGGGVTGFIGANSSWVGARRGGFFAANLSRETFPAYNQTDLRAGVSMNGWTLAAYVNNVGTPEAFYAAGAIQHSASHTHTL